VGDLVALFYQVEGLKDGRMVSKAEAVRGRRKNLNAERKNCRAKKNKGLK
jgi:hypothetical protein